MRSQVMGQVIDTGPISDGTKIDEPVMQLLKNKKGDGSSFAFTAPIEDELGQIIGYLMLVEDPDRWGILSELGYDLLKYFYWPVFAGLIVTRLIIIRAVGKPIKK